MLEEAEVVERVSFMESNAKGSNTFFANYFDAKSSGGGGSLNMNLKRLSFGGGKK